MELTNPIPPSKIQRLRKLFTFLVLSRVSVGDNSNDSSFVRITVCDWPEQKTRRCNGQQCRQFFVHGQRLNQGPEAAGQHALAKIHASLCHSPLLETVPFMKMVKEVVSAQPKE